MGTDNFWVRVHVNPGPESHLQAGEKSSPICNRTPEAAGLGVVPCGPVQRKLYWGKNTLDGCPETSSRINLMFTDVVSLFSLHPFNVYPQGFSSTEDSGSRVLKRTFEILGPKVQLILFRIRTYMESFTMFYQLTPGDPVEGSPGQVATSQRLGDGAATAAQIPGFLGLIHRRENRKNLRDGTSHRTTS